MGNWERLVWNQRDVLLAGLGVTVEVCAIAFIAAIVGGLALCLIRLYVAPLRPIAILLIEFFRDTPIFVQLMWVAYVWPEVFGFPSTASSPPAGLRSRCSRADISPKPSAPGIEAVPRGQRDAAFSAGMSQPQTFTRIVMPQVALATAPSIVNQFTVIVKSSTLISVITVPDLMSQSQKLVNVWYEPIEILTATAAIYIAFVFLISIAGKILADRLRQRYGLAAS